MIISASILSKKYNYKELIKELNKTDVDMIHIDVMDGKFVSDKSFSITELEEINNLTNIPLDVHLMVNNPKKYIEKLYLYNIKYITFHIEATKNPKELIDLIHSYGINAGISIIPNTNPNVLFPYIKDLDLILILTVTPGASGQEFMTSNVYKIEVLKHKIEELKLTTKIEVDGGINNANKELLKSAGSDILVSASYIHGLDMQNKISSLR